MARQMYETPHDRENEANLISALGPRMRCQFKKLPIKYGLDYIVIKEENPVGFVEFKFRTIPMGKYDTYMISLHKVMMARELMEVTGLPAYLIVQWTDAVGRIRFPTRVQELGYNGRRDRNDSDDVEPVALLPIKDFEVLPV